MNIIGNEEKEILCRCIDYEKYFIRGDEWHSKIEVGIHENI